jgi:hypothetical protein
LTDLPRTASIQAGAAKVKKASHRTTNVVSALTARTQFERFVVDRRGEPAVIVMSVSDYTDFFAPEPGWLAGIRAKSKARDTDKLSMTKIDAMMSKVRRSSGKAIHKVELGQAFCMVRLRTGRG